MDTKKFVVVLFTWCMLSFSLQGMAQDVEPAKKEAPSQKLKVLFLCTGNSCRSQMAEGWARHLRSDAIEAYSAGIETHGLNPNAVRVMQEAGVDISSQKSKNVKELIDVPFDYVITVCGHADEHCPAFPKSVKVIHHPFDDPPKLAKAFEKEEEQLNCYRRVRDEIRTFVKTLPNSLSTAAIKCPIPAEGEKINAAPASAISNTKEHKRNRGLLRFRGRTISR